MKVLILAAPIARLFLITTNAYATQFSFDPATGEPNGKFDFRLPAARIGIIAAAGAFLTIHERRKAKGIWFSNNEPLK